MARSRNIKPGIITNDELASTSPFARLVFIYSWMLADYNGNLEYKPVKLKVQTLPYDDVDIDGLVTELERFGFVKRYDENGSRYMHICNFKKHQNPHKNEITRGSDLPVFDDSKASTEPKEKDSIKQCHTAHSEKVATKTERVPSQNGTDPADSLSLIPDPGYLIPDASPNDLGSAPSGESPSAKAESSLEFPTKRGEIFQLDESFALELRNTYPRIDVAHQLQKARLWLIANPSKQKTLKGMTRFLNNWMNNQKPTAEIHPIQSRHTGFADRDYSEGLIEGVADNAANF
jgi:uncharacterized protein YlbG (UPF0298 family)